MLHKSVRERYGKTKTSAYTTWQGMIQRCHNPNHASYYKYGARGITVCSKWKQSFSEFFLDMGEPPIGKSLDRIDNNGNYEPVNCRWATPHEQSLNTRMNKRNTSGVTGVSWSKIAKKWQVTYCKKHYGFFEDIEKPIEKRKLVEASNL